MGRLLPVVWINPLSGQVLGVCLSLDPLGVMLPPAQGGAVSELGSADYIAAKLLFKADTLNPKL